MEIKPLFPKALSFSCMFSRFVGKYLIFPMKDSGNEYMYFFQNFKFLITHFIHCSKTFIKVFSKINLKWT